MILQAIRSTLFFMPIVLALQAHAQDFEVDAWLERCVVTASDVPDVYTSDGGTLEFGVTSCLTTARRTCQFADDAVGCFSQYTDAVQRLSRNIRADLPEKVDGESWSSNRLNRLLSDDNVSDENNNEHCLNSVESELPVELLYLPVELRAPAEACRILVPSLELGLLLLTKNLIDKKQANE